MWRCIRSNSKRTSSSPRPLAGQAPQELLELVFRQLERDPTRSFSLNIWLVQDDSLACQYALKSAAQVCRAWNGPATRALYACVRLRDAFACVLLGRTLTARRELGYYIHYAQLPLDASLNLGSYWQLCRFARFIRRDSPAKREVRLYNALSQLTGHGLCPNLRAVSSYTGLGFPPKDCRLWFNAGLGTQLEYYQATSYLHRIPLNNWNSLWRRINGERDASGFIDPMSLPVVFTNLRTLHLCSLNVMMYNQTDAIFQQRDKITRVFPVLQELIFDNGQTRDDTLVGFVLALRKTLRTLVLNDTIMWTLEDGEHEWRDPLAQMVKNLLRGAEQDAVPLLALEELVVGYSNCTAGPVNLANEPIHLPQLTQLRHLGIVSWLLHLIPEVPSLLEQLSVYFPPEELALDTCLNRLGVLRRSVSRWKTQAVRLRSISHRASVSHGQELAERDLVAALLSFSLVGIGVKGETTIR